MLVAISRLPADDAALSAGARVTGLSLVDVRSRLAGVLPRVLLAEADPDEARARAAALEAVGFGVLLCDPAAVETDDDRLVAKALAFSPDGLVVADGADAREECAFAAVALIQRAVRRTTTTETTTKTTRQLAVGRAILSGGVMLTKKAEHKETRTSSTEEPFLCLSRVDGGRDVVIYERRIDYRFLGSALEASSTANFARFIHLLRQAAPRVPYDDRVGRPGFVAGVRFASADPVDVALHLVRLLHHAAV